MFNFLNDTGLSHLLGKVKTLLTGYATTDDLSDKVSKTGDTMSGNLNFPNQKGVWTKDGTGYDYPIFQDNGTNLWLGATQTASKHHIGGFFISAGVRKNGTPYQSIYISVPNATNTNATNYEVYHKGNLTASIVYKGNFANTADINATDIDIGMYTLKGYNITTPSGTKKMYGTFIQCGGEYLTQIVTGGTDGTSGLLYIRRYIVGTTSWSDWYEYHEEIEALKTNIPTKTSDLTNDSGFIDNTVSDLVNYTDTTTLNSQLATKQDTLTVEEYYYDDFEYNTLYDTDGVTVVTEIQPYNTVDSNADTPHALKYGRTVNLTGSLKTVGARPTTATFLAGYVPKGLEPRWTVKTRQQGSSQNSYLCEVRTNGGIYISRYGAATNVAVPNNAWLNINMTYISAN